MPYHINKNNADKGFEKGALKRTLRLFHHKLNERPEEGGKYRFPTMENLCDL